MGDGRPNREIAGVWLALLLALIVVAVVTGGDADRPAGGGAAATTGAADARVAPAPHTGDVAPRQSPSRARARARGAVVDVARTAARVERIRRLRFRTRPVPQIVSPARARREGLADLDRSYPAAQRHADEEVLTLLGLLDPGTDLRKVSAAVYEGQVAGYYDPRSGRLRVVRGAATAGRALTEITL